MYSASLTPMIARNAKSWWKFAACPINSVTDDHTPRLAMINHFRFRRSATAPPSGLQSA